jgi:hypothetical protein
MCLVLIIRNWDKKIERFLKTVFKLQDGNGISAIQPTIYQQRFCKRAVMDVFDGIDDGTTKISTKNRISKATPRPISLKSDKRFIAAPISNGARNLTEVKHSKVTELHMDL